MHLSRLIFAISVLALSEALAIPRILVRDASEISATSSAFVARDESLVLAKWSRDEQAENTHKKKIGSKPDKCTNKDKNKEEKTGWWVRDAQTAETHKKKETGKKFDDCEDNEMDDEDRKNHEWDKQGKGKSDGEHGKDSEGSKENKSGKNDKEPGKYDQKNGKDWKSGKDGEHGKDEHIGKGKHDNPHEKGGSDDKKDGKDWKSGKDAKQHQGDGHGKHQKDEMTHDNLGKGKENDEKKHDDPKKDTKPVKSCALATKGKACVTSKWGYSISGTCDTTHFWGKDYQVCRFWNKEKN